MQSLVSLERGASFTEKESLACRATPVVYIGGASGVAGAAEIGVAVQVHAEQAAVCLTGGRCRRVATYCALPCGIKHTTSGRSDYSGVHHA